MKLLHDARPPEHPPLPQNSSIRETRTARLRARSDVMDRGMRPFERVFTVTDYYDGPRRGIASFDGRPHAYDSPFDHWEERYEDLYELRPVDEMTFRIALEEWEIWLRWEAAFHAGTKTIDSHPALGPDRARHEELARDLAGRLAALPGPVIQARAVFRPTGQPSDGGSRRWLEVQWTPVGPVDESTARRGTDPP
jgi:hypothetical protein